MAEVSIDCVDGTGNDEYAQTVRRALPSALRVHSVGHMARSVEGELHSNDLIRRLRVFGHGAPGHQGLGRSYQPGPAHLAIRMTNGQLQYQDELARLQGRFAAGGWAELHGCSVGAGSEGRALVLALAQLWQVPVAAGTYLQTPRAGFEVHYIVGRPNGQVEQRSGRPFPRPMDSAGTAALLFFVSPNVGLGALVGVTLAELQFQREHR